MELEKLSIQELEKLLSEKRRLKLIQKILKLDKPLNSPQTSNYVIDSFDSNQNSSKKKEKEKLLESDDDNDDDDDDDSDDDDSDDSDNGDVDAGNYNAANFEIEKVQSIQRIIAHERFSNFFTANKGACKEIFTQAPQESKSEVFFYLKIN